MASETNKNPFMASPLQNSFTAGKMFLPCYSTDFFLPVILPTILSCMCSYSAHNVDIRVVEYLVLGIQAALSPRQSRCDDVNTYVIDEIDYI